jgi:hypothetical protein
MLILSAPARSRRWICSMFVMPPPTVRGMKHSSAKSCTESISGSLPSRQAVMSTSTSSSTSRVL